MNKYKKALHNIKEELETAFGCDEFNVNVIDDYDIIAELVERATPKKPYNPPTQGFIDFDCPRCYKYICTNERKRSINFCPHCGQKLYWGDD